MSKRMVGLGAGLAVASVAALASPLSSAVAATPVALAATTVAASASFTASHEAPAPAGPAAVTTLREAPVAQAVAPHAVTPHAVTGSAVAPRPVPPKPVVNTFKVVRKVYLQLPETAMVGANVTGFVQVTDNNGQVESPVAGVDVQFQRKDGSRWTVLSEDLTDDNGVMGVAFQSQTNVSLRAVYVPTKGTKINSATLKFTAPSQVTWAARPDLEVTAKKAVGYAFRVNAGFVATGHLEFALASKPDKWTSGPSARVDAAGVVAAKVTFPAAGTYLVRGTTGKSATNAPGYTSTLTVVVE